MGDIDDDASAGLQDALQLLDKCRIVGKMFEIIDHHHLVECAGGEWGPRPIQLVDILLDQLPNRRHCPSIEVCAMPTAAATPQQITYDPVIRADVEVGFPGRILQQFDDPVKLGLLEYGTVEQRDGPIGLRRLRQSRSLAWYGRREPTGSEG